MVKSYHRISHAEFLPVWNQEDLQQCSCSCQYLGILWHW